jgi:hypothetical protein
MIKMETFADFGKMESKEVRMFFLFKKIFEY